MAFETWYLVTLKNYFSQYRDFLEFNETHLEKVICEFDVANPIDASLEISDPEYYHFLIDNISESWWRVSRDFPSEFRTTFLSQIYNGIDSHLNKICLQYQESHGLTKSWKDMKGTEWARKAKYLKKYAHLDFEDLTEDWNFLENIRQIRNLIVHHHTSICANDKDWEEVKKFIVEHTDMIKFKNDINKKLRDGTLLYETQPDHYYEILIHSPELNRQLLDRGESFFRKLLPQLSFV